MTSPWILASCVGALLFAATAAAQEPATRPADSRPAGPAAEIAAIDKEFNDALNAVFEAFKNAKTDEEKQKLLKENYPKPERWFPRLFEIAKANAKSAAAEGALMWIVEHDQDGPARDQALDLLMRDHLDSERVVDAAFAISGSISPKAEEFLKVLEEKSPRREVRGRALYARAEQKRNLAEMADSIQNESDPKELAEISKYYKPAELARLKAVDPAKVGKEIEEILVRVKESYGDVALGEGATIGERAGADLFEIRNLAIGKVAPDIEGEDVQNKPLRLADFRGKVVVLDFWGNW